MLASFLRDAFFILNDEDKAREIVLYKKKNPDLSEKEFKYLLKREWGNLIKRCRRVIPGPADLLNRFNDTISVFTPIEGTVQYNDQTSRQ